MTINVFDIESNVNEFQEKKTEVVSDLYKPNVGKGVGGIYDSIVRFVPFLPDPQQSVIVKRCGKITDEVTGQYKYLDCPTSIKQHSPINDIYWKLKNSNKASDVELCSKFSTWRSYFALVQIIEDKNRPELEGKIVVFTFGQTIMDKIEEELKPKSTRTKPRVPWALFEGRPFQIHVSKRGEWPDYSGSRFLEDEQSVIVNGSEINPSDYDPQEVLDYLNENSPDLMKYAFKEWTPEDYEFVYDAIQHNIGNQELVAMVVNASRKNQGTVLTGDATIETVSNVRYAEDAPPVKRTTTKAAKPVKAVEPDDDDDDFEFDLSDIDLG